MRRLFGPSVVLAAAALLESTEPSAGRLLAALRRPGQSADPFDPLVAGLTLLAWAVLGWLAVVLASSVVAQLPGAAGRAASAVARLLTPAVVRAGVETLLGVSVAVGVATPTPALAGSGTRPPPIPAAAERGLIPVMPVRVAVPAVPPPLLAPVLAAPELDWPVPVPVPVPAAGRGPSCTGGAPPPGRAGARRTVVVVRPGSSLWQIAAASLPPSAGPARIARAWPRWWAANRSVIGPDPDLILPGMALVPPA